MQDQVTFHNEGSLEYFVDFTLDLQAFESIFGAQLGHVSHLSLYFHTDSDEYVGYARSGRSANVPRHPAYSLLHQRSEGLERGLRV